MRKKLTALVLAATLACAMSTQAMAVTAPPPVPAHAGHLNPGAVWFVGGCAASIILAAAVVGNRDHRQLTSAEAMSCGLGVWLAPIFGKK